MNPIHFFGNGIRFSIELRSHDDASYITCTSGIQALSDVIIIMRKRHRQYPNADIAIEAIAYDEDLIEQTSTQYYYLPEELDAIFDE